MVIIAFTKVKLPYGWLGNMSPHPIQYDGHTFRTSEHLFQCLRFPHELSIRQEIMDQASPMAAKMVAKKYRDKMQVMPQSAADLDNMRLCLYLKWSQHSAVAEGLAATGKATLVKDCTKRQQGSGLFWGAALGKNGNWTGANVLGNLWMDLRDGKEYRVEVEYDDDGASFAGVPGAATQRRAEILRVRAYDSSLARFLANRLIGQCYQTVRRVRLCN